MGRRHGHQALERSRIDLDHRRLLRFEADGLVRGVLAGSRIRGGLDGRIDVLREAHERHALKLRHDHPGPEPVLRGDARLLDLAHDDVLAAHREPDPAVEPTERDRREPDGERRGSDDGREAIDGPLVHGLDSSRGSARAGSGESRNGRPGRPGWLQRRPATTILDVTASTAPTARLGGGRRRFPLVTVLVVVLGVGIAGCAGPLAAERSPVPAGPLGPVVARADAVGPDIECRGVARDRCLAAGTIEGADRRRARSWTSSG